MIPTSSSTGSVLGEVVYGFLSYLFSTSSKHRKVVGLSTFFLIVLGLGLGALGKFQSGTWWNLGIGALVLAGLLVVVVGAYQLNIDQLQRQTATEERLHESELKLENALPEEKPQAAWLLGKTVLEAQLEANLVNQKSIFRIAIFASTLGFALLMTGASLVLWQRDRLEAAQVSVVSGAIVSFMSATLLVIYKSTLQQTKEYMLVLEKINAVGMAVTLLEPIKSDQKLYNQTLVEISKSLLSLYGPESNIVKSSQRKPARRTVKTEEAE